MCTASHVGQPVGCFALLTVPEAHNPDVTADVKFSQSHADKVHQTITDYMVAAVETYIQDSRHNPRVRARVSARVCVHASRLAVLTMSMVRKIDVIADLQFIHSRPDIVLMTISDFMMTRTDAYV